MRGRIKGFDGLRGIAVFLVVLNHKFYMAAQIGLGEYGVHLFFVLSGYLIIGILFNRRHAIAEGRTTFRREIIHFYENRLFRIWPIYFLLVFTVIAAGALGLTRPLSGQEIIALFTFTSNIFQSYVWLTYPLLIAPLWSVAIEEQFYLWAAPVFLLISPRKFTLVCLLVIAQAILVGVLTYLSGQYLRSIYTGSLTNFGLMALGGLTVVAIAPNFRLAKAALPAFALYLLCPFISAAIGRYSGFSYLVLYGSGILIALVLAGIVSDQSSRLVRFLELAPVRYIGTISYGLYLYHDAINLPSVDGVGPHFLHLRALVEIALSVAIAGLSWRLIETPILKYKDRLRARRNEPERGALPGQPSAQASS